PVYGYDKEIQDKLAAKYDVERERQARKYIEDAIGESLEGEFLDALHDGTALCKLANAVVPGRIKINTSRLAFKQMENINSFLSTAKEIGCPSHELFQTVDLFEAKNPGQVVDAIFSFSRNAAKRGFSTPALGPKLADSSHRTWTREQLRAG
ncbi:putative muscular protein, partial [Martensiomyces pterosporus]